MGELAYELRDDGVCYELAGETSVLVKGKSARSVYVIIRRGNAIVVPETGNLASSKFREKLVEEARERLGEVNGLADELGHIAIAFDEHVKEREEAAEKHHDKTSDPAFRGSPYYVARGGFGRMKSTRDGEVLTQLTNFTAKVEEEVVKDDGGEAPKRYYRITGKTEDGVHLPTVDVPASQFAALNWVEDAWGIKARTTAGPSVRDYVREAVQLYSRGAP